MPRVLIIGYGNSLRGDDGAGWQIARALLETNADAEIEIVACHQLTPELAEPLSRAQRAIFVDAVADAARAGVAVEKIFAADPAAPTCSHHVTPAVLLDNARVWYGAMPRDAFLISLCARALGFGERVSNEMARDIPRALAEIAKLCARRDERDSVLTDE